MLKKFNSSYKIQLFTICALSVTLILLCWIFMSIEVGKYKNSVIESYSTNQEILINEVAEDVEARLSNTAGLDYLTVGKAEAAAVTDIIMNAETSGSKYWFFYSSAGVIFEKNAEETRHVEGKNASELIRYWTMKGGNGTDAFEKLLSDRKNGTAVFTKDMKTGKEIVSVQYFKIGNKEYYLGMATSWTYIMSTERVNEHILYLYIFCAAVSLFLAVAVLLLCLKIYTEYKKSTTAYESLVDKTLQIQELTRKLAAKSEAVQTASIYDNLTKLYNRKFFDNLVDRVKNEQLMPVSIVVLDINGLKKLNSLAGYYAGDEILNQMADILRRVCIGSDVVARTGSSEFSVLMTSTKEAAAYATAKNAMRQFYDINDNQLTLSMGVAQMQEDNNSIFAVFEEARKNLSIAKMLDKNSNNSEIVTMLMEALAAYSTKTVDHCNRLMWTAIDLGNVLGMSPAQFSRLAVAAQLHDVGKIGIPDSILNKKTPLTDEERELVRRHSELGYKIVKSIPSLDEVAVDIFQHHENYDGSGYPLGLEGENISLNARIIHILDSFDAMTNKSVYATTKTIEEAIRELYHSSHLQYDPHILNEFVKSIEKNMLSGRTSDSDFLNERIEKSIS